MGEGRKVYRVLVGNPEGKKSFGRWRRGWEDEIKMYLREIGWEGVECTYLPQNRDQWQAFVDAVMNLLVLVLWS
jgi:hypothetical protein